ncbi:DUF2515 family protein [Siminovitchia acidinfaciens]|uniref:DUF2515 family protein n=1 Tax=Siminovitchia acidinfaciens TaxID=2321395 RepID=UPI001F1C0F31|nr:DUF2515 family protein [Siminovitchia acidinfaciens]
MTKSLYSAQTYDFDDLSCEERTIVGHIKQTTGLLNVNNVSRTKAYLDFYRQYPEIHWAFLGHAVSRNGGWNMTDLKGDLLSRLMNEKKQEEFFEFLERGNWLIFQDAYPQFLLYGESIRRKRGLFHLLPHFGISKFMEVIWEDFWYRRDSYILAMAQVVNEQSYLEARMIQNPFYMEKVLHTLEFVLQDLLSFNQILFPSLKKGRKTVLTGMTIHQFGSLHERIILGRRLYHLLFSDRQRHQDILIWCMIQPHSGSRKDYWPQIFNDVNEGLPGPLQIRRLRNCRLIRNSPRLYSPRLEYAWPNMKHRPAEPGDWFDDCSVVRYLIENDEPVDGKITGDYCETLQNLELAALAKKTVFI